MFMKIKLRLNIKKQELREKFDAEATSSGKPLLLSVAFGCRKPDIDAGYEIDKLALYLDYFNLMSYDLRGSMDEIASHHSALYSGSYEEGEQKVFNQVIFAIFCIIFVRKKLNNVYFSHLGLGSKLFH